MNKKGFTLVELLAVIAILAILVILALPNVLEMFNRAKKEIFLTEAKTIYKEVSKKYISENMKGNSITKISNTLNKLDIDANNYEYNINLDNKGYIKNVKITNGTYCLRGNKTTVNDLTIDDIEEGDCSGNPNAPEVLKCTYDGKLVQGAEFVRGPYTYRYKQQGGNLKDNEGISWMYLGTDGWGVQLTDKSSTNPVSGEICSSINGKPVVSTNAMFRYSHASSIDISNFNSSNVVNMNSMFYGSYATEIIGLEKLDTRNVTSMGNMFNSSKAENINLEYFSTSKVTVMDSMFASTAVTELDLSSLDTRNVVKMQYMFSGSKVDSLDVSSLDTSKVTNMSNMFSGAKTKKLIGLENFNTSNVTSFGAMFMFSDVEYINLTNFDTSNATTLENMFNNSHGKEVK